MSHITKPHAQCTCQLLTLNIKFQNICCFDCNPLRVCMYEVRRVADGAMNEIFSTLKIGAID